MGASRLDAGALVGLLPRLGVLLSSAWEKYHALRAAGIEVTPDVLATYLGGQASDWRPKVSGVEILDDATREAGVRFLAGVAFRLAEAAHGRGRVAA